MIARFRGTCGWCYCTIVPGNEIILTHEWGWVHRDPICERYRGTRYRVTEEVENVQNSSQTRRVKNLASVNPQERKR